MTEHDIQTAFMEYVRVRANQVPELKWLHAIPNGGARNVVVARKMKAEGVVRYKLEWAKFREDSADRYLLLQRVKGQAAFTEI